jgi:predicted small lipoprotein YifL
MKVFRAGCAICYGAAGGSGVTRLAHLCVGRIGVVAALAAALTLAGCGRKSGLDEPPLAAAGDQGAPTAQPAGAATNTPDGKPVAPSAEKRRTPLDWLIN